MIALIPEWVTGVVAGIIVLALFALIIVGIFWLVDPNKKKRK